MFIFEKVVCKRQIIIDRYKCTKLSTCTLSSNKLIRAIDVFVIVMALIKSLKMNS